MVFTEFIRGSDINKIIIRGSDINEIIIRGSDINEIIIRGSEIVGSTLRRINLCLMKKSHKLLILLISYWKVNSCLIFDLSPLPKNILFWDLSESKKNWKKKRNIKEFFKEFSKNEYNQSSLNKALINWKKKYI